MDSWLGSKSFNGTPQLAMKGLSWSSPCLCAQSRQLSLPSSSFRKCFPLSSPLFIACLCTPSSRKISYRFDCKWTPRNLQVTVTTSRPLPPISISISIFLSLSLFWPFKLNQSRQPVCLAHHCSPVSEKQFASRMRRILNLARTHCL